MKSVLILEKRCFRCMHFMSIVGFYFIEYMFGCSVYVFQNRCDIRHHRFQAVAGDCCDVDDDG